MELNPTKETSPDERNRDVASSTKAGRRLGVVVLCVLVVGVGALALRPGPKEPVYQGKKLSEWVDFNAQLGPTIIVDGLPPEGQLASARAIHHIGTNGLPFLVKWLAYQRPAWRKAAFSAYDKLPLGFQKSSIQSWIHGVDPATRRDGVLWCFWIHGSNAAPAIPDLVELTRDPKVARDAIVCLGFIGSPAKSVLTKLAEGPDERLRSQATLAIHGILPRPWEKTKGGDWPEPNTLPRRP